MLLAPSFSNLSSGSPSFVNINISIDTPRVYVYALFKGGYTKCSIFYLRDAASIVLSVHVGLQFVVYPSRTSNLMHPMVRIKFRTCAKLVVPHQFVALRSLWSIWINFAGILLYVNCFACRPGHDGDMPHACFIGGVG